MKELDLFDLVNNTPDDNSGSTASNRFGYQKNWVIYKLLELEMLGRDYMIIMDYHEDVIILDSSTEKNNIDFYQVKTRSGDYWRPSELVKSKIPFSKFKTETQKSIKKSIISEFPNINENVWEHLFISQEQLKTDNYKDDIIGVIDRFIDKKLPTAEIRSTTLYDSLFSEVESLQDFEGGIKEKDILTIKKSFRHSDFQNYIKKLANFESYDRKCDRIIDNYLSYASDEEMNFVRKRKIIKILRNKIKTLAYDYNDTELIQLKNLISSLVELIEPELDGNDNEWTAANKVLPLLNNKYNNYKGFDQDELLALILLEYAC